MDSCQHYFLCRKWWEENYCSEGWKQRAECKKWTIMFCLSLYFPFCLLKSLVISTVGVKIRSLTKTLSIFNSAISIEVINFKKIPFHWEFDNKIMNSHFDFDSKCCRTWPYNQKVQLMGWMNFFNFYVLQSFDYLSQCSLCTSFSFAERGTVGFLKKKKSISRNFYYIFR